jgi:holo-[acyl-carrier protein] synthase
MIFGIGHDQIDIRRIEASLARFGARFEARLFTENEQAKARKRSDHGKNNSRASTYAKRFAAKEACAKALGTGMTQGVRWRDIEVVNLPSGKPTIRLHGTAKHLLERAAMGQHAQLQLTLSDDYPTATAIVVIEFI